MNEGKTSDKCVAILPLLVFLALCKICRATAALLWFRAVFLRQATTFVHFLWFLEELIKVKLSDDILLRIKTLNINDLLVFLYNNLSISNRYTSLNVQDTALPLLSTIGRLMISCPPWKSTREGSCLARGEVLTLYLLGNNSNGLSVIILVLKYRRTLSDDAKWEELTSLKPLHNVQCPLSQTWVQDSCTCRIDVEVGKSQKRHFIQTLFCYHYCRQKSHLFKMFKFTVHFYQY